MRLSHLVFSCWLAAAATAQSARIVPAGHGYATKPGPHDMTQGFAGNPNVAGNFARAQAVYTSTALGFKRGVLSEVAFRRDAVNAGTYPAMARRFLVKLGHTAKDPDKLPFRFSQVLPKSAATVVFSGTVNMPAAKWLGRVAHPWSIVLKLSAPWSYDAARGNLVLEWESDGAAGTPWAADAHSDYSGGVPGNIRRLTAGCRGSNGLEFKVFHTVDQIATGRTIQLVAYNVPRQVGAVTALVGVHPRNPPVRIPGTNGCVLAIDALASDVLPTFFEGAAGFNCAVVEYRVPNDPQLFRQSFTHQWAYRDAKANALGVVSSEAFQVTVGKGPSKRYQLQTNSIFFRGLDVAYQLGAEFGPIVRITGKFGG